MGGFVHGHVGKGGRHRSYTYNSWRAMRERCTNPKRSHCRRGITYDPRWDSFESFLMDMGERPPGCELSRRDHDAPYCLLNCEWAESGPEQRSNRGPKAPRKV